MPPLLRQGNANLKRDNIFVWSLPAYTIKLLDGRVINTCPSASICSTMCYALNGSYNYSNVLKAHVRNLLMVLDEPDEWEARMTYEVSTPRFKGANVRIHDGGDFFSTDYMQRWMRIIASAPDTTFYAYTKEVLLFKRLMQAPEGKKPVLPKPDNFHYLFSMGGLQDKYIDLENDRHADVFPSRRALIEAGYSDQTSSDLLAYKLDTNRIGIVANNIKHFLKLMGAESFGEFQRQRRNHASDLAGRRKLRLEPDPKPDKRVPLYDFDDPDDLQPAMLGVFADQVAIPKPKGERARRGLVDIDTSKLYGQDTLDPVLSPLTRPEQFWDSAGLNLA